MDRVKFGRALGYGARHAAKTLAQAAEAASAPNPTASKPLSRPVERRPSAVPRGIPDVQTVRAAGKQAKSSIVTPVVRFSSVVWLQVTGVFFALIAFTMGMATWKARAGWHSAAANSHGSIKLFAYLAVCALFTYFSISSFVRSARR